MRKRESCAVREINLIKVNIVKIKKINYKGTEIEVHSDGTVVWNNSIRNHYPNKDGYIMVAIKTEKGWRGLGLHILMAIAFVENDDPDNKTEVHHKDYNRANYAIDNLQWVTHAENVQLSKCNRPDYSGDKNPNYGNDTLAKRYKADKQFALNKQSRPGAQNGRAISIKMYNSQYSYDFGYIDECAKYLKDTMQLKISIPIIHKHINQSIKNNSHYLGFNFTRRE